MAVNCSNPQVHLSVARDPELANEPTLVVDYPLSTGRPDERDIWLDVEHTNWSQGAGICFLARPSSALRLSVSFMGTNGVAYTAWANLDAGAWQPVKILFVDIRPNPYFQPPGINPNAPINVSLVKQLGFAPQDKGPGRIAISKVQLCQQ
jgi:hypothetical protein